MCMHGCNDDVLIWNGTIGAECSSDRQDVVYSGRFAAGNDYGQQAVREYHAFWDVYKHGKSCRCICDGGSNGRTDTYAVYASDTRTVGTWLHDLAAWWQAGASSEL